MIVNTNKREKEDGNSTRAFQNSKHYYKVSLCLQIIRKHEFGERKQLIHDFCLYEKSHIGRFPNFNSYKLSVLSHKCDRRESKLPISIHFSKYNTWYIYLIHIMSMRRNDEQFIEFIWNWKKNLRDNKDWQSNMPITFHQDYRRNKTMILAPVNTF